MRTIFFLQHCRFVEQIPRPMELALPKQPKQLRTRLSASSSIMYRSDEKNEYKKMVDKRNKEEVQE
jgi:hypothetical protein